jgi:hypothetical protein
MSRDKRRPTKPLAVPGEGRPASSPLPANTGVGFTETALQERVTDMLSRRVEQLGVYHDHKENQAYAGTALAVAAFTSIVIADRWPPAWVKSQWPSWSWAIEWFTLTLTWLLIRKFIAWQLSQRRYAAIWIAAGEEVLLRWLWAQPQESDLRPRGKGASPIEAPPPRLARLMDGFFRLRVDADVHASAFPAAVADTIDRITPRYTGTRLHETILLLAGWIFYGLACLRILVS